MRGKIYSTNIEIFDEAYYRLIGYAYNNGFLERYSSQGKKGIVDVGQSEAIARLQYFGSQGKLFGIKPEIFLGVVDPYKIEKSEIATG